MAHQSLQSWITTVVGKYPAGTFTDEFAKDPSGVLTAAGFQLDPTYHARLNMLSDENRRKMAQFFTDIAAAIGDGKPEVLRALYARYAEQAEDFYQWEGVRDPGIRSWF